MGYRFRRQHPIGDYIPDFVCLPKRLVIEIDGGYHFIGNQQINDQERTHYLNLHGFDVIRFSNEEILGDTDNVIMKIQKAMDNKASINSAPRRTREMEGTSPLLRRGRGRLLIFSAPSGSGKYSIVILMFIE